MTDVARQKADLIVAAARERKAFDLVLLKVDHFTTIADYFFICSGRSNRQVQSVAEHIQAQVKKTGGFRPLGTEGLGQGHWVLLDYGDVVVHVFYEPVRRIYDLESLWIEAQKMDLGFKDESGIRPFHRTDTLLEKDGRP